MADNLRAIQRAGATAGAGPSTALSKQRLQQIGGNLNNFGKTQNVNQGRQQAAAEARSAAADQASIDKAQAAARAAIWKRQVADARAAQAQMSAAQKAAADKAAADDKAAAVARAVQWRQQVAQAKAAAAEEKAAVKAAKTEETILAKQQAAAMKAQWQTQVRDAKAAAAQELAAQKAVAAQEKALAKEVTAAKTQVQAKYTAAVKADGQAQANVTRAQANLATIQSTKSVGRFSAEVTRNTDHITNWGKNIQWLGRQLQYNFTMPLERLGRMGFQNLMAVETATTSLKKVYGDAGDSAAQFAQDQNQLSQAFRILSDTYGESLADVTNLAAAWAAAGYTGAALAKAVKNTMDVMILANGDIQTQEEAFKALIAIQTAYNLSTDELVAQLGVMNVIANKTAIQFGDIVDVVSKAGGSARTAGVDLRTLASMAAALVPATGSAANAGNALKTIFSRLLAPTKAAAGALKEIGINVDEMSWQNSTAAQRLEIMATKFEDLTAAQQAYVVAQVAGRYQLNKVDVLLRAITDSQSAYNQALDASAPSAENAQKMAKQYQDQIQLLLKSSPQGFKILTTQLQNLLMDIIIPLIPAITQIVKIVVQLVGMFNDLSPAVQQFVIIGLAMIAIIGPILRIVGAFTILIGIFGKLWSLVGVVVGFFSTTATLEESAALGALSLAEAQATAATAAVAMAEAEVAAWSVTSGAAGTGSAAEIAAIEAVNAAKASAIAANEAVAASAATAAGAEAAAWLAPIAPILLGVAAAAAVIAAIYIFRDQIGDFFHWLGSGLSTAWEAIVDFANNVADIAGQAFSAFPKAVMSAFKAVVSIIASAAKAVYDWLSYFNPFARHSPSLVEQVNAGVDIITAKYKSLAGLSTVFRRAAQDFKSFMDVTAGTRAGFDSAKDKEQRDKIVAAQPDAAPQVDALYGSLSDLKAQLVLVANEWAKQKIVVDAAEAAYNKLNDQVDAADAVLDKLKATQKSYADELDIAQAQFDKYSNAQVAGTQAWSDAIFENQMAQNALKLQIMDLEQASGMSYSDIESRIAAINGEIEGLQGTIQGLQQSGAGSDVLKPYLDQLESLSGQQTGLGDSADQIQSLQAALDALQQTGDHLNLEQSLALDPLNHELEKLRSNIVEMPFDEIVAGLASSKAKVDELTKSYDDATAAVDAQQKIVDTLTAARDALKDTYDVEKAKLDELSDGYSAIEEQIQNITSALNDWAQAADAAASAGGGGAGGGGGGGMPTGDFADPAGSGLGEGGGDLNQLIEDWKKQLQDMFPDIDLLSPFKWAWQKVKDFLNSRTVKDFVQWLYDIQQAIYGFVGRIAKWIHDYIVTPLNDTYENLKQWGMNVVRFFEELGGQLWKAIQNLPGQIGDLGSTLAGKAKELIDGFMAAVIEKAVDIWTWFANLPGWIVETIGAVLTTLQNKGIDIITGFLTGILQKALEVIQWFKDLPGNILSWIGDVASTLKTKGLDLVQGLWNGLIDRFSGVVTWVSGRPQAVVDAIGDVGSKLADKGRDFIQGLWDGLIGLWEGVNGVAHWIGGLPQKAIDALGDFAGRIKDALVSGFKAAWNAAVDVFNELGSHVPTVHIPGTDLDIEVPTLHHMNYMGGLVNSKMLTTLGERGPEVVLNSGQATNALRSIWAAANNRETAAPQGGGNGGGRTININGDLSFPNIKTGDDAEKFLRNLESLATT